MRKAKKRGRIRKGKRQKQNARQESSNCKNLTCLNDILQVLKVDKDTVQNFIQQNRRLKSRLELAGLSNCLNLFHLLPSTCIHVISKFNPIFISFHRFGGFLFIFHLDLFHLFRFSLITLSLIISGSKGNKSGNLNGTLNLLVSVFGGASALKKGAPICAGRYNSTKANEVSVWD